MGSSKNVNTTVLHTTLCEKLRNIVQFVVVKHIFANSMYFSDNFFLLLNLFLGNLHSFLPNYENVIKFNHFC